MTRDEGRSAAISDTPNVKLIVDNARPGFPHGLREDLESVGVNFSRVYPVIESHRFDYLLAAIDEAEDQLAWNAIRSEVILD